MAPKIETDEQALAATRERLEGSEQYAFDLVVLGYRGTSYLVGATMRDWRQPSRPVVRKDVYIVGPRGGLDRWISADPEFAAHLAGFLS